MDNKTNEELFKQALIDGVNMRIDRELAACEEEVVFSRLIALILSLFFFVL